ncbi:hypothetical protein FHP29_14285 [Nocardioides albidus]|uniref:Uncharacterized protein n=1 Tax=Nocardioides albidus TaxID=1517589 RepID=A0A5C4VRA3_9ACTN|nr:hypothetical protein [Nocardioides albidus]TNM38423.1 hypothetical protein FHP29_14285 [Nocardioides albidus]
MSDTTEPLSPDEEEAVRRVLAEAAGPVPMPAEVAERLDGVIAGLAAERATGRLAGGVHESHPEAPAVVVPLDPAALRRRRRVRVLFGAAAAVAAVVAGVGVVSDRQGGEDLSAAHEMAKDDSARDSAGALVEGADGAGADEAELPPSPEAAAAPSADDRGGSGAPYVEPRRVATDQPVREVRVQHLREDLVALQHLTLPHPQGLDYSAVTLTAPADFMCEPADFGLGQLIGVRYDGKPAVVAFRMPVGSTQVAEVLACGTGDVLHSTTLAATG